ncbi:hypothetical protein BFJ69_g8121 [Fusarium oxysporum]|uniref:Uncharacterized protein n=1 Tax=Fusarium oxysporum TaxID=5507 RepID=A0A420N416_FUSOX|nr:hypothetical protein BFJ69_g8121 [Fusarium oxysporum]
MHLCPASEQLTNVYDIVYHLVVKRILFGGHMLVETFEDFDT